MSTRCSSNRGKTHLVGLLVGLLLLLGLLGLGDSGLSGSVSDLGLGVSLGQDGSEVGADNSSLNAVERSITQSRVSHAWTFAGRAGEGDPSTNLVLDGLPAPLLGNLLGHSLLVHTTVDNSPGDLSGVLPLEEEGLGLRVDEPEDL